MGDSIARMSPSSSEGRRVRRFARGKMVGIASASAIVTLVWLFVACSPSVGDLCDPSRYPGTTTNSVYLAECCAPADYPGGVVTDMRCPTYGESADGGDGGDAMTDGPIGPPCPGECTCPQPPPRLGLSGPRVGRLGRRGAAVPALVGGALGRPKKNPVPSGT